MEFRTPNEMLLSAKHVDPLITLMAAESLFFCSVLEVVHRCL